MHCSAVERSSSAPVIKTTSEIARWVFRKRWTSYQAFRQGKPMSRNNRAKWDGLKNKKTILN